MQPIQWIEQSTSALVGASLWTKLCKIQDKSSLPIHLPHKIGNKNQVATTLQSKLLEGCRASTYTCDIWKSIIMQAIAFFLHFIWMNFQN
jgi:hypothetical protein